MPIKELVEFIGQPNIADQLKEDDLRKLGQDVIDRFDQDVGSMDEWSDAVDFGLKLVKQELRSKSTPWDGAANFKSPILTEASLAFGNRASLELLRSRNLVRADLIGIKTQGQAISRQAELLDKAKQQFVQQQEQQQQAQEQGQQQDPQSAQQLQQAQSQIAQEEQALEERREAMRDKRERADRVTEVMNYQINHKMKEWRKDQKRLLYTIPNVGTIFKKTIFDPLLGRNVSQVIHYPDFAVNQATTDIDTARSFTHILDVSNNKIFENQQAGIWLDEDLYPEDSDGDEGSNEKEQVTDATDNPNRFLEQYCFADLDDDGYEEPYIITVHEMSRKVVRVVARFDFESIVVTNDNGLVVTLIEAVRDKNISLMEQARAQGLPDDALVPEDPDFKGLKLTRIEADQPITKYGFIPSQDGTFLDLGYFHLLGGITMGVNATTNMLLNAGKLATTQGGFLAKGFRKKMGPISFRPGEFKSTQIPAGQLVGGILPLPIKEPSPTLFALNEKLDAQGRQFAASVDATGQIQANTAPTTALAIIQEQLIPLSALMGRIIDSQSEEFQKIFKLDQKFFDPILYQQILDDPQADFEKDFNSDDFDIVPTANAEMSSKMQRIQLNQVQVEQIPNVLLVGGNPIPIMKSFFEGIGSDIVDEVFPDEAKMSTEDRRQLDALRAQQEQQNQLLQQQNQIAQFQAGLFERSEERKDFEAQTKARKTDSDIEKQDIEMDETLADTENTQANTVKTLEEAETEAVTNKTDIYTKALGG